MPLYADLNPANLRTKESPAEMLARERTVAGLRRLRHGLAIVEGGPPPRSPRTLMLATWNIREFDSEKWGPRLPESYAYIAEIVDRFDLVAVQEVREDLTALEHLQRRLGHHWDYLVSDVTEGVAGNRERLAFLYDTRKVDFLDVVGELVLPAKGKEAVTQLARTPFLASFQVGWTKFVLTTVHILWGTKNANPPKRVEEIRQVAQFLRKRSEDEHEQIRNIVVLGDFNIFKQDDATARALTDAGFVIPVGANDLAGTNASKDRKYDQIAYLTRRDRFQPTGRAGTFDYYEYVFRNDEGLVYRPYIDEYLAAHPHDEEVEVDASDEPVDVYREWRTYQMSDHLPLWAEFEVDFSDAYLEEIAATASPTAPAEPEPGRPPRSAERRPLAVG
jgi:endonuclease/exonuclease/phosphatase family metal-dependent hydrolase